ncbi:protein ALP1-like [Acropora millepora]|uniref:protein ALP1-like n=1 Tax=Acropora millepora TaxID=45264 RepID=UPI001CF3E158|nr:protein ALP1-like [Acropora millepora]
MTEEMTGLGNSTVCGILSEVTKAIVNNLWSGQVTRHFPRNEEEFREKILDMEDLRQFPCSWAVTDGCHIPLKRPVGGLQANKEYHNFKNFYSIVLMGMVDARHRFVWASCGFPENSHDSIIIFQSTNLWSEITYGQTIPDIGKDVEGDNVPPLILGDSAFPFRSWLMKPYTSAVLTPSQKYYNYRLSRARMSIEEAYGELKDRWRVLQRKCESAQEEVRDNTLACIVLHNICIERGETLCRQIDEIVDTATNQRRPRDIIRHLLNMTNCHPVRDTCPQATRIRNVLTQKLWRENQGYGVL